MLFTIGPCLDESTHLDKDHIESETFFRGEIHPKMLTVKGVYKRCITKSIQTEVSVSLFSLIEKIILVATLWRP